MAAHQRTSEPTQSEQRYRRLLEATTDYIYRVRVADGRAVETIHGANCEVVTGYTQQDFAANPTLWISMVPPEDRTIVEQQAARTLSGQDAPPIEHRIRRKDGQIRWVSNTVSPEHDDQGHLIAYDGLLRDVTERKNAEEAPRQLNETLQQRVAQQTREYQLLVKAVSNLGEGVLITNDQLEWPGPHILFVNEAMCRISGYTADELIGKSPRILQGNGTDRATLDRVKAELSAGRSCLAELINYRKDGTQYDAEVFIAPLLDAEGHRTNFVSIHRDISQRKAADRVLHRARFAIEHSHDAIFWIEPDGNLLFVNDAACKLSGYGRDELLSKAVTVFYEDLAAGEWPQWWERIKAAGSLMLERRFRCKNGHVFPVEVSPNYVKYGEQEFLCTFVRDITKRKRAEQALRESEERMQAILNTAADAIITIDQRGIIKSANPATERIFGYTQDELAGQNVSILMPRPYCDEYDGYIARYLETGEARIIGIGREVVAKRKDGSTFPVDLAVSQIDHLGLFAGVIRDISERRELQKRILEIAAGEQRRIGQELHDGTGQELTGLSLFAGTLLEVLNVASRRETDGKAIWVLEEADFLRLQKIASRLSQGLVEANRHVHQLSHGIMPVHIDTEGLRSALEELAAATDAQEKVTCRFECSGPVALANSTTAKHLYRIAQEALNNALRHGRAKRIDISISQKNDQVILEVSDSGIGFDWTTRHDVRRAGGGMGLRIMEYRAGMIGGVLDIERNEAGGTLVRCSVLRGRGGGG